MLQGDGDWTLVRGGGRPGEDGRARGRAPNKTSSTATTGSCLHVGPIEQERPSQDNLVQGPIPGWGGAPKTEPGGPNR